MIPHSEEEFYFKLFNMVSSSQEYLRLVFKQRYKSETEKDWIDDVTHISLFFKGLGTQIYKNAQKNDKLKFDSTTVAEWDMTLLSLALRNFGSAITYKTEDAAVKQLKDMRNYLCHHSTNKITKDEYLAKVKVFSESLKSLGMERTKIEEVIDKAGITSSLEALKYINTLFEKADLFLKDGKFSEAQKCYNEAIMTPSLLEINRATCYEKRAEYFLNLIKNLNIDKNICKNIMQDVAEALKLNESSWNAYYLAAKCHRLQNELDKAIDSYETALAISPSQSQVRIDLNSCKVLNGIHYREDHLNPEILPISLKDRIQNSKFPFERKLSEKEYIELHENLYGSLIPGQDHVFRGHKYFMGWTVPQDLTLAIKNYSCAAKVKNAEGMYNLAMCYHYGYGTDQDLEEALKIYKEVANMDRNTAGNKTPSFESNVGVASAQHDLGLMYEYGIGVMPDFREAAFWYQKGMDNGMANSANNLGILYSKGRGVLRDLKMAEICWEKSVLLGDINAPASLMTYYICEMEPEKARNMLEIGRKLGNCMLKSMSDVEFESVVKRLIKDRKEMEPMILMFERSKNLDSSDLTFKRRFTRMMGSLDANVGKLIKIAENLEFKGGSEFPESGGCFRTLTSEMILEIEKRAVSGSETAKNCINTLKSYFNLCEMLDSVNDTNGSANDLKILDLLYECVIQEVHIIPVLAEEEKLKPMLENLFRSKCDNKEDIDMKTRMCYVVINLSHLIYSEDMTAIKILKESVRRYPKNIHFYDKLSSLLLFKEEYYDIAIQYIEEGLKLDPNNPDLLYNFAVAHHFQKEPENDLEILEHISKFQRFINEAPYDHRKIPEAYYRISSFHIAGYKLAEDNENLMKLLKLNFERGVEAEKYQLPCYLPYGSLPSRNLVEAIVESCDAKEKKALSVQENILSKVSDDKQEEESNFLENPKRVELVLQHREKMRNPNTNIFSAFPRIRTAYLQFPAQQMSLVTPITLSEMTSTSDFIYENRIIDLLIMDDPVVHEDLVVLIAEDTHKSMTRVLISNVDENIETGKMFGAGCRIAIINPYVVVGENDGNCVIWSNEPRCIVYLEKTSGMCRVCGKEYSQYQCRKCKRTFCSDECKIYDREKLNHKTICSIKY